MPDAPKPAANPYRPPAALLALAAKSERAPEDDSLRAELRAYVGRNHAYYLRKWEPLLREKRARAGFCWWALWFGCLYFFFRRMYLYGVLFLFAEVALIVVLALLGWLGFKPLVGQFLLLGLGSFTGACAHGLYFDSASREVERAKQEGHEGPELLKALRARGGPNYWLPANLLFGGTVVFALLVRFLSS